MSITYKEYNEQYRLPEQEQAEKFAKQIAQLCQFV